MERTVVRKVKRLEDKRIGWYQMQRGIEAKTVGWAFLPNTKLSRHITIKFAAVLMLLLFSPAFADDGGSLSALVTPRNVEFNTCTRSYIITPEKLFYMAVAGINANRFTIDEIQSKTGYILFSAVGKQYLAAVVQVDSQKAMLKITPTNNNYFFAPGIVSNIFRYIDLNGATPVVNLSKI